LSNAENYGKNSVASYVNIPRDCNSFYRNTRGKQGGCSEVFTPSYLPEKPTPPCPGLPVDAWMQSTLLVAKQ